MRAFGYCDRCGRYHVGGPDEVGCDDNRGPIMQFGSSHRPIARKAIPPLDTGRLSASITKPPPTPSPSYGFCVGCHHTHFRAGDCADQVRPDPLPPPNPALSNPLWKEGRPAKGFAVFRTGPFEVIDTWDFSFWRWFARLFVRRDEFPKRIA
jgi:hypothetical protein